MQGFKAPISISARFLQIPDLLGELTALAYSAPPDLLVVFKWGYF